MVEPEILLDGDHPIDRTLEVAEKVWSEVFYYLAENNVVFEGILLKPSMVTPGAEHKEKASADTIAKYTLTMLKRRVPPAVPGIMVWILEPCFYQESKLMYIYFLNTSVPSSYHVKLNSKGLECLKPNIACPIMGTGLINWMIWLILLLLAIWSRMLPSVLFKRF